MLDGTAATEIGPYRPFYRQRRKSLAGAVYEAIFKAITQAEPSITEDFQQLGLISY